MGAIISGLLDLLQWLASTIGGFFSWLVATIQAVATWFLGLLQWVFVHAWNLLIEFIQWVLTVVFWFLGNILVLPLKLAGLVVALLPNMPKDWSFMGNVVIPAFNVANQILPISEALAVGSLWLTFYGLMAAWRVITFIRGGR